MLGGTHNRPRRPSRRLTASFAALAALLVAPSAFAHVERASYWPDPAPDTTVTPAAGGEVPKIRGLYTALNPGPAGDTRVVCQGGEPLAYRANKLIDGRFDQAVSKRRVRKLQRHHRKLKRGTRNAKRKGFTRKVRKKKGQRRKNKRKLTRAKRAYRAALRAEQIAREGGQQALQQAIDAEFAARRAYRAQLATQPSIQRLDAALAAAVANGYELRPSEPRVPVTQQEANRLRDFNAQLLASCNYDSIQAAVNDSGNNDRVVVMPGVYTEPDSRAATTNDPECDDLEEMNDRPDGMGGLRTGANSYAYVATCPNDQNLIAVIGREPMHDQVEQPPLDDRHGIPDEGECIRCNLQLEGSGIKPDDVVIDAGDPAKGNGPDHDDPGTPLQDRKKDVGIRVDRADGNVINNITVRHVREHGIYHHETDGYLAQRFKVYQAEEYGTLNFTSDHGVMRDCDVAGSGDAAIYPGSAPDSGAQGVAEGQLPARRFNTEIARCDMRHSALGYSGTAANAVWLHHNDFYDNAQGFSTDVFTAAGHPGFPQDSDLLEHNEFYSNNFNPYLPPCDTDAGETPGPNGPAQGCSDIDPTVPVPVGSAGWIAGGNDNVFRNNHVWDNWRRGMWLFSVPDAFVCGDSPTAGGNQQHGCNEAEINTSYRNEFHDNVMGRSPDAPADPTWPGGRDEPDLNGQDFAWDKFLGNTGNCWYGNVGPDGTRESLTADPPIRPAALGGEVGPSVPLFLPHDCATSVGTSNIAVEAELLNCLANFDEGAPTPCTWFDTPPEP
ncbi:hypothetical protein BH20ACT15_BH20ACT15_01750 [soil metagenome]